MSAKTSQPPPGSSEKPPKRAKPKRVIHPLELSPKLLERLEIAWNELEMSKAEVMRMAMKIGLEQLERISYKIEAPILTAAMAFESAPLQSVTSAKVAEEPAPYRITKQQGKT